METRSKVLNRFPRSPGVPAKRRAEAPSFIKQNIMFTILSASLSLLPLATAKAWETASGIAGNLIGAVPFLISAPGRFFLANNLTSGNVTGTAITINADEAILDQFFYYKATTTTETEYTFS